MGQAQQERRAVLIVEDDAGLREFTATLMRWPFLPVILTSGHALKLAEDGDQMLLCSNALFVVLAARLQWVSNSNLGNQSVTPRTQQHRGW
jgi:hypothetical protein